MPCDSVITTNIDLSKANVDVLAKALQSLGMTVTFTKDRTSLSAWSREGQVQWTYGKGATVTSASSTFSEKVAPAYSKVALETAAKKWGWNWKQVKDNVFEVARR